MGHEAEVLRARLVERPDAGHPLAGVTPHRAVDAGSYLTQRIGSQRGVLQRPGGFGVSFGFSGAFLGCAVTEQTAAVKTMTVEKTTKRAVFVRNMGVFISLG